MRVLAFPVIRLLLAAAPGGDRVDGCLIPSDGDTEGEDLGARRARR